MLLQLGCFESDGVTRVGDGEGKLVRDGWLVISRQTVNDGVLPLPQRWKDHNPTTSDIKQTKKLALFFEVLDDLILQT